MRSALLALLLWQQQLSKVSALQCSRGVISTDAPAPELGRRAALLIALPAALLPLAARAESFVVPKKDRGSQLMQRSDGPTAAFEEAEALRVEREKQLQKNQAAFKAKVRAIERASGVDEFSDACDALALEIIGNGGIPEGTPVKELVSRVRLAYTDLPKSKYAEFAYSALIKEIRKYTPSSQGASGGSISAF